MEEPRPSSASQDNESASSLAQADRMQDADRREPFDAEDYLVSFSALKESVAQGRDLKKKRKALDEYRKTLATLEAAYEDRVNVARDPEAIVREQEHIVAATNDEIDKAAKKRAGVEKRIAEANESLSKLKEDMARERKPYVDELELRNAELAAAKDELRQVKSQRDSLDLFEGDPERDQASEAAHDAVVEKVNGKYEAAKAAQRSAQKALDAKEKEERSKQKRAQDGIKQLNDEKEKVERHIEELEKRIFVANERIAFCAHVLDHPEETEEMRSRILGNRETARQMAQQIDRLAAIHEKSKASAKKARMVVIGAAIVVILIVVAIIVFLNR